MPKLPSPPAPIISLTALCSLYRIAKKIPKSPDRITDAEYTEKLSEHLIKDGVLGKDGNQNFINAFKGRPTEADWKRAPGLATDKLSKIAAVVIAELSLDKFFHLHKPIEFPWDTFSEIIFATPNHLKYLDEKKYYKYLSIDEKTLVDHYIDRRLNELGIVKDSSVNYCLYMWNMDYNQVRCAVLTLNQELNTATYSYFAPIDNGGWAPKSIMKATNFSVESSILFLDLVDEDSNKSFIRANILVSILDAQFVNLTILKGLITVAGHNGTTPICCEVILEKCNTFYEAYNKVIDDKAKNPQLCLEIQNKRFEIKEANIFSWSKLRTFALFNVLEEIQGTYRYGFINEIGGKLPPGSLSIGLCHIGNDGIVYMEAPYANKPSKGYVDQTVFRGLKHIRINYFLSDKNEGFDFEYHLKIEKTYPENKVTHLYGFYTGIINGILYRGDIVYFKQRENYTDYNHARSQFEPYAIEKKNLGSMSDDDKKVYKFLEDMKTINAIQ